MQKVTGQSTGSSRDENAGQGQVSELQLAQSEFDKLAEVYLPQRTNRSTFEFLHPHPTATNFDFGRFEDS